MGLIVVTPPSALPVTLDEQKKHSRILHEEDDAMLQSLIRSATAHIERSLSMTIAEQTLRLELDSFSGSIKLPRGPVTAVTSVKYVGLDGTEQTVDPSNYIVDLASSEQWVVPNAGYSWPDHLSTVNAVRVTYKAGFATLPAYLEDLKVAIKMLVAHWYDNRAAVADSKVELPMAVKAIVDGYRAVMV